MYSLRSLHGQWYEKELERKKEKQQKRILNSSTPETVFLIGTPVHPNIGDSAIAVAEMAFLRKVLPRDSSIVEVTEDMLKRHRELVERRIRKSADRPIFWHGGGNMGDLWLEQEQMRRGVFSRFPEKRIIAFPQTIFYSNTEEGRRLAEESVPYYNGREGLTLLAREPRSFEIMKDLFPQTEVHLMPDIVLSSSAEEFGVKPQQRKGVLMCLRNAVEKSIPDSTWTRMKECISQLGESYRVTDMGAKTIIEPEIRAEVVRRKMQEFRGARLAVTDRLHGMVFAALTGTPCIVFGNYNHKVKSAYQWISYLPYIRYTDSLQDAEQALPELLAMDDCKFDNSPLLPFFDQFAGIVREACR